MTHSTMAHGKGRRQRVGCSPWSSAVTPTASRSGPSAVSPVSHWSPRPDSPVPCGVCAAHECPSADVHSATSARPGRPAAPATTKPLDVAVTAVAEELRSLESAPSGPALGSRTSCHDAPPSDEANAKAVRPEEGVAVPIATSREPLTATRSNQPSSEPAGCGNRFSVHSRPSVEVQTAGRPRGASLTAGSLRPPTATKPEGAAATPRIHRLAVCLPARSPPLPACQDFRSGENQVPAENPDSP